MGPEDARLVMGGKEGQRMNRCGVKWQVVTAYELAAEGTRIRLGCQDGLLMVRRQRKTQAMRRGGRLGGPKGDNCLPVLERDGIGQARMG